MDKPKKIIIPVGNWGDTMLSNWEEWLEYCEKMETKVKEVLDYCNILEDKNKELGKKESAATSRASLLERALDKTCLKLQEYDSYLPCPPGTKAWGSAKWKEWSFDDKDNVAMWKWDASDFNNTGWRCSNCGKLFSDSIYDQDGYRDDPLEFPSNYCPNCGADMRSYGREECKNCNGSGFVQIGPNIRGIKICPVCNGRKIIIR